MADTLRTRITAAVADYHQRWGIKCECGADHAHAFGVADAVIRELGLKKEWLERPHSEERDIRWVTDWMPDA